MTRARPDLPDPEGALTAGHVLIDGRVVTNPRSQVRADASVVVKPPRALRGEDKLRAALDGFAIDVTDRECVDLGASAGGFTRVLLEHGARRVFAVDAGHGQLRGELRNHSRVVNLERTNLADLSAIPRCALIGTVTMDLSYLSVADAAPQIETLPFAPDADLIALVKPMFELGLDSPPEDDPTLRRALDLAVAGVERLPWHVVGTMASPVTGSKGAREWLLHARRSQRRSVPGGAHTRAPDRLGRMERAVILEGARTPVGKFLGSFADVPAVELGTVAAREAMRRANVEPGSIDQTIYGHARQAGNGPNTGRQVSVRAGVPVEVSAYNVNIACGSGMKAVQLGAQQVALGDSEVVLAGGMENMTRVPFLLPQMRTGYRLGNADVVDAMYRDGLLDPLSGLIMGETAENLVDMYDITREEQDEFALESQQKARDGAERRAAEIVPVEVPGPKGSTSTVTQDEHPRPDTTAEGLARLEPVFREGGSVTAGNSAGITDGAAALVLMSESRARSEGREPLARILGISWAGVPPEIMGIGPVPATKKILEQTGLSLADIDLIEINEAFAAQVIACERELKFDRDVLNVNGGGISIGHPIGMSGARIILSLAYEMRARGAALGLATLCISGGQGLAVILERP